MLAQDLILSGRHYIMSGGFEGLKETYADLVSRVQSFGRYMSASCLLHDGNILI